MSPFEVYVKYLSLKRHFSNKKYDYFKYNKKTRASIESFNKRRDKYWYEKTSRKYSDKEIESFFVSNFVAIDNAQTLWIGEIINSGERIYNEWMKRQQSLSYLFKEQSSELFSEIKLEDIFKCNNGHPILLKKYLSGSISPENMVIYNKIFGYTNNFDKKLIDPVWETIGLKIRKYDPFINIDVFQYKKILRNIMCK